MLAAEIRSPVFEYRLLAEVQEDSSGNDLILEGSEGDRAVVFRQEVLPELFEVPDGAEAEARGVGA